jgi:hypothetical protein
MLKRILVIGVIGVSFAVMRGDDAEAHLAGTVYVPTYRHISSYDCTGTFAQVPGLKQHPALFACSTVVHAFQVTCKNPQGRIVNPGTPGGPITQFAQNFLLEEGQTIEDKEKGTATLTLPLPDTVRDAADVICKERNRNFSVADELVLAVDVWLRSYDCPDLVGDPTCAGRVQASESYLRCTVPPQFSLPNNPPPGGGVATNYDCTLLGEAHCDQGSACPIPPVPFP